MERRNNSPANPEASSGRVGKLRKTLARFMKVSGRENLTLGANQIEVSLDNVQDDASFFTWLDSQWQQSNAKFQKG